MNKIVKITDKISSIIIIRKNGDVAPFLIDREDVPKIENLHWTNHFSYCCTNDECGNQINIWYFLCEAPPPGYMFYHRNRDRRDNRKCNIDVMMLDEKHSPEMA